MNEVLHHLEMAEDLGKHPIQLDLKRGRHWFELTLVTNDRPFLFGKRSWNFGRMGYEHCEGECFFEPGGNGR